MCSPFQPDDNNLDERTFYALHWTGVLRPAADPSALFAAGSFPRAASTAAGINEIASCAAIRQLQQLLEARPEPDPLLGETASSRLGKLVHLGAATVVGAAIMLGAVTLTRAAQYQGPSVAAANGRQGTLMQVSHLEQMFASLQSGDSRHAAQTAGSTARLTVEDRRGVVKKSIRFGNYFTGTAGGSFVLVSELAPGPRLAVGPPVGQGGWIIPTRDLANLQVVPPKNFVGISELPVDLRFSDNGEAERNVLRLERTELSEPTADSVSTHTSPSGGVRLAPNASAPARQLDREEIDTLINRGEAFLAAGDVASARLMLQRAGEAGDAHAALTLGATYDPTVLKQLDVVGIGADVAQARVWYEKAAELGSVQAPLRLRWLTRQAP